jgi:hypothetical protein
MIAKQEKAKGGQPYQSTGLSENPVDLPITLAQAGVDKNLAHRARRLAKLTEEDFENHFELPDRNFF